MPVIFQKQSDFLGSGSLPQVAVGMSFTFPYSGDLPDNRVSTIISGSYFTRGIDATSRRAALYPSSMWNKYILGPPSSSTSIEDGRFGSLNRGLQNFSGSFNFPNIGHFEDINREGILDIFIFPIPQNGIATEDSIDFVITAYWSDGSTNQLITGSYRDTIPTTMDYCFNASGVPYIVMDPCTNDDGITSVIWAQGDFGMVSCGQDGTGMGNSVFTIDPDGTINVSSVSPFGGYHGRSIEDNFGWIRIAEGRQPKVILDIGLED